MSKKILGVVGGIAPPSTIEYYRRLVDGVRRRTNEREYPSIIINSINLRLTFPLFEADDRRGAVALFATEVARLARAGADVALIAANTPHLYFADIAQQSPIPLLSIVEAVAQRAARNGHRRLLLLGTRFTMRGTFYAEALAPFHIEVVAPGDGDAELVHDRYVSELALGRVTDAMRQEVSAVIQRSHARDRVDGVILGGTELSILFDVDEVDGIPLLDTTQIHVDAAIEALGYS